ncbi:hypothetical protein AcW2_006185 [Taiwanofungus camphoratus]|nr:hypothetical protein AcW2_006185 [Antrodia cinnamomea]
MASNVRSRKGPNSPEVDVSSLNNTERLILSQAVYEFGSNAWVEVSKLLTKHPLMTLPKNFFTAQSCRVIYLQLMEDAGLESLEADTAPHASVHLKLAQRHYQRRVLELRDLIAVEEAKFKTLVNEIDEIRADRSDGGSHIEAVPVTPPSSVPPDLSSNVSKEQALARALVAAGEGSVETTTISNFNTVYNATSEAQGLEAEAGTIYATLTPQTNITADDSQVSSVEQEVAVPHGEPKYDATDIVSPELVKPPVCTELTAETMDENAAIASAEDPDRSGPAQIAEEAHLPAIENAVLYTDEQPATAVSPATTQMAIEDPSAEEVEEDTVIDEMQVAPAVIPITIGESTTRVDGKRKISEVENVHSESQREKKRAREDSEPPEDDDLGSSAGPKTRKRERQLTGDTHIVSKRFQNVIGMLHSQISQHRYGNIFHNPIKKFEAPDYHDIVKRPMDLKTIKARIKDGLISNSLEFQRDVYLMFANALMYNRPGSDVCNMAEEMMLASEGHINTFRQTEGFHRM